MKLNTETVRVLIMAGGTGGHVFPALALARELKRRNCVVEWLGTRAGIESRIVPAENIKLHCIEVSGIRGKKLQAMLLAPFRITSAISQARHVLKSFMPHVVVGLGGYAAGPGGIAAWLQRIPLIIHEQNARAGTTNRILAPFARRVLSGFPAALKRAEWVGNPVRREIGEIPEPSVRLPHQAAGINLLVLGGSLGAQALNQTVPAALQIMPADVRPQVVHQCGEKGLGITQTIYGEAGVEADIRPFIDDMAEALAWADLVICRAGALTVAELCAAGVASVLVPFPYAIDDHQTANGQWLVQQGAATMYQQNVLSAVTLQQAIMQFISDPERIVNMAMAARELARPDAADKFADICLELAHV